MSPETEMRKLMLCIKLAAGSDIRRIQNDVPNVISLIDSLCQDNKEIVYRSKDGLDFAFFILSKKPLRVIRSALEQSPYTINGDSFLVLELGREFEGLGFSRAWTWLQHN